jgi:low temperature requirement protein LtrA
MSRKSRNLLRKREPNEHARVGFIELFFDLVFVFAVTQLSHKLLESLTPRGALETLILFMAVWWAWIDTAWVTNWLDPEKRPVRLMLFALMLAGLILSTSLPEAFGPRGIAFACAYACIQVGRSLFTLAALKGHDEGNHRNFQRITIWAAGSSVLWIAGAFADPNLRLALWAIAVAADNIAPSAGFWTPWHGRSTPADWQVEGAHLAERCGLFIIIALGESILVTGGTFAALEWNPTSIASMIVAFTGSVAMWWIYFDSGHERGSDRIAHSSEPGRLARLAYTYIHLPIIAGIIICAVSDDIVLAHPLGDLDAAAIAVILGGPALYVGGTLFFRWSITRHVSRSQIGGLVLLALLVPAAHALTPLVLGALATLVLIAVAVSEQLRRRAAMRRSHNRRTAAKAKRAGPA